MRTPLWTCLIVCILSTIGAAALAQDTEAYTVDASHAGIRFKISHLGLSWVQGRFDDLSGQFTLDRQNPANCAFELEAKTDSVDTNNRKRDDHLRVPISSTPSNSRASPSKAQRFERRRKATK